MHRILLMTSITARQSTALTEKVELLRSISNVCRHFKPQDGFPFAFPTVALYYLKEMWKLSNMQFCKITLYFIWLHYFQKIQNPRCIIILCDCIRSPQNLQLTVKRMHPTLGSWFGNPSFRYLWSQNLHQGKAEQLNPVTHSDRYLLLSRTNR